MIPKKRLGQHFLTDPNILRRIVDALDPAVDDVVVEIGPGQGSLTRELLARGLRVIAIEKDRGLAEQTRLRIADCGFDRGQVVLGDALEQDWHALIHSRVANPQSAIPVPQFKIVGNIPYNITSPLLAKALTPPLPACVVFLMQSEVAERVAARPGTRTYGALSIGVQALCRVERLFTVKAGAFRPPPKVDSALVRLTPLPQPLVPLEDVAAFRRFVTACFGRRRKQLRNVLAGVTERSPTDVAAGLAALGIAPVARPETLPPEDFARLLIWSRSL